MFTYSNKGHQSHLCVALKSNVNSTDLKDNSNG